MKPANCWVYIALWLLSFLDATNAQGDDDSSQGVSWQYPTKGLTFYLSDTVDVVYASNFTNPLLYTFCSSGTASPQLKGNQSATPDNGTTSVYLGWTDDAQTCWFDLRPDEMAGHGSNSETFQYQLTQRSQPVLDSEQSSSSSISSPTSTITMEPANATPGLSATAQAGIGVGAGLGGFGVAALITTLVLRRYKKREKSAENNHYKGMPPAQYPGFQREGGHTHGPGYSPPPLYATSNRPERSHYGPTVHTPMPQELDSNWLPAELSSHGKG
ncbi:hypothetical protein F4779DRAFT_568809 [Xylariaceae sp. FL0662B]|nr:hypothetical protein F4779DRAFT_568809 [Xylariaceae sp. FL0662B]